MIIKAKVIFNYGEGIKEEHDFNGDLRKVKSDVSLIISEIEKKLSIKDRDKIKLKIEAENINDKYIKTLEEEFLRGV